MATERVTREGGGTTIVERGGGMGVGGVLIGLAVLALVAIIGFFLIGQNRNDAIRTDAVSSAASSVGQAADNVGNAVTPK
jgi:hypothetical protein